MVVGRADGLIVLCGAASEGAPHPASSGLWRARPVPVGADS